MAQSSEVVSHCRRIGRERLRVAGTLDAAPVADLQLDIRAGTGLNNNAADFFTGFGVSVRI